MNSKIFSKVPPDYYDKGTRTNLLQWIWHNWKCYSLVPFISDTKGKILDVGCADGTLTAKLAKFAPKSKVVGLDLHRRSINYAKKRHSSISFIVADARKIPFKNNSFDFVVCVETLEHIPKNEKVVSEIYRVLNKGGTFIVAQDTDNFAFKAIWAVWTKMKGKVWHGAHVNCMRPSEVKKMLQSAGFRIVKIKYSHLGLEVIFKAEKK